jgi:hypothetical protein
MQYEIINPSDQCFMVHEDKKIAITACLVLGSGLYGLTDESGKSVLPILAFSGSKEFLKEEFGGTDEYGSFLAKNYAGIADALESVYLPGERSSMNDIVDRAHKLCARLRDSIK